MNTEVAKYHGLLNTLQLIIFRTTYKEISATSVSHALRGMNMNTFEDFKVEVEAKAHTLYEEQFNE